MSYRMLASFMAVMALALGGGVAQAHNTTFETNVEFQAEYNASGVLGLAGQVSAQRAKCVPDRTVKVFAVLQDGSRRLADIARTSDNGAFAAVGDFTGAVDALARVTRKNIGGSGHRHICAKASTTFIDDTNNNSP